MEGWGKSWSFTLVFNNLKMSDNQGSRLTNEHSDTNFSIVTKFNLRQDCALAAMSVFLKSAHKVRDAFILSGA
jgi:hypothetical protein